jgi:hypothetical protein
MQEGLLLACFVYQNGSTMAFIFPGISNPWKWSCQEKQHVKRKEKKSKNEKNLFPFFFLKKNSLFFYVYTSYMPRAMPWVNYFFHFIKS